MALYETQQGHLLEGALQSARRLEEYESQAERKISALLTKAAKASAAYMKTHFKNIEDVSWKNLGPSYGSGGQSTHVASVEVEFTDGRMVDLTITVTDSDYGDFMLNTGALMSDDAGYEVELENMKDLERKLSNMRLLWGWAKDGSLLEEKARKAYGKVAPATGLQRLTEAKKQLMERVKDPYHHYRVLAGIRPNLPSLDESRSGLTEHERRAYDLLEASSGKIKWRQMDDTIWVGEAKVSTENVGGRKSMKTVMFRIDARRKPVRVDIKTSMMPWEAIDGGDGVKSVTAGKKFAQRWLQAAGEQASFSPKLESIQETVLAEGYLRRPKEYPRPYTEKNLRSILVDCQMRLAGASEFGHGLVAEGVWDEQDFDRYQDAMDDAINIIRQIYVHLE